MSLPLFPAASDALFLDFDGTLVEIASDPMAPHLSTEQSGLLRTLSARLDGALCLISGRSAPDLASRTPVELWRAGNHGTVIAPPGRPAPRMAATPAVLRRLGEELAHRHPGTLLELKGPVITLHYRAAPEAGGDIRAAFESVLAELPDYRLLGGKMLWELRPDGHDKGFALRRLMADAPFHGRRPVMVGDDLTDEDGFRAALALGGRALRVGAGDSAATERLADVAAVWRWLRGLTGGA